MHIWIDGDACPKAIKEILFRAAIKRKVTLYLVANHFVQLPASPYIKRVMVNAGFDEADEYIVEHVQTNDLVITADIILADKIIHQKAIALNPKGTLYDKDNIKHILAMRNLNESLRSSGMIHSQTSKLSSQEIQQFSNHLDKILTRSEMT